MLDSVRAGAIEATILVSLMGLERSPNTPPPHDEGTSGEDLGWFFQQWACASGFPLLKVAALAFRDATLVTIEQVQEPGEPTSRLSLVVELRAEDGRGGPVVRS